MATGVEFFVSYARKDKSSQRLVAELKYQLPRAGHEVWVDIDIDPAGRWNEDIDRHIDACDAFVILLSAKALRSKYVGSEFERARKRNEATDRPQIIPVRVNYSRPRSLRDFEEILSPVDQFEWESKGDTPKFVIWIEDAISKLEQHATSPIVVAPPRTIPKALLIASAVLIAILLVAAAMTVRDLQKLSGEIPETEARATYARLRTAQAWLLPRLWLIGPWNPQRVAESYWTNRGAALDADAAKRLANRRRRVADEGLIVAALAAVKRGTPPLPAARAYYDAQHYAQLVATLRFAEPVQGTALAAYRSSTNILLADGSHVFRCTPQWTCDVTTLTIDAAREAAFVDETNLITVTADGRVDQWDLGAFNAPIGRHFVLQGAGVAVAAANGNYAIAFDAKPYLYVNIAGRRVASPPRLGRVTRIAFGPCGDCLTTLNANGRAQIWDYAAGTITELGDGVLDLAATRNGALAIAWRSGVVGFYDAQPRGIGTETPLAAEEIDGMAISDDGHRVAIAHDGVVTLVDDGGSKQTLIPADKRPSPVAVAWSAGVVLTRTPEQSRVWLPSSPRSVQRDVAPGDAWREWRKQLGLTVDASGKVVTGTAGVSQLGWNRAERRIDEQP